MMPGPVSSGTWKGSMRRPIIWTSLRRAIALVAGIRSGALQHFCGSGPRFAWLRGAVKGPASAVFYATTGKILSPSVPLPSSGQALACSAIPFFLADG